MQEIIDVLGWPELCLSLTIEASPGGEDAVVQG